MKRAFYIKNTRRQAISWLLMLGLLALALFPYHYHLPHDDRASAAAMGSQGHAVEFHTVLDLGETDHQHHDHTIDSSTDITLKSVGVQLPFVVLILSLLLTLPSFAPSGRPQHALAACKLPNSFRHKVPPLRAPPQR